MVNIIRTIYPRDLKKGFNSKFRVSSQVQHKMPEESWRMYRPKRYEYNNEDEIKNSKILSDKDLSFFSFYINFSSSFNYLVVFLSFFLSFFFLPFLFSFFFLFFIFRWYYFWFHTLFFRFHYRSSSFFFFIISLVFFNQFYISGKLNFSNYSFHPFYVFIYLIRFILIFYSIIFFLIRWYLLSPWFINTSTLSFFLSSFLSC